MTTRERNLIIIFLVLLGSLAILIAVDAYLGRLGQLDQDFVALQKSAVRATQSSLMARAGTEAPVLSGLKQRFYASGGLPSPLALAALTQTSLKSSGLSLLESKITESGATEQWIRYNVEGTIDAWFSFLKSLRQKDPKSLFRSLSMMRKAGFSYSITFEVGHVVLP